MTDIIADISAELSRMSGAAIARLCDPHYVDSRTGHRVAKDELLALAYLEAIDLDGPRDEQKGSSTHLQSVREAANSAKQRFAAEANDTEGFGSATFAEFTRFLDALIARQATSKRHPFRERQRLLNGL